MKIIVHKPSIIDIYVYNTVFRYTKKSVQVPRLQCESKHNYFPPPTPTLSRSMLDWMSRGIDRCNCASIEPLHAKFIALSDVQPEVEEYHEQDGGNHRKRRVFHFEFESQQLETFVARPVHTLRFVFHLIAAVSFDLPLFISGKIMITHNVKLGNQWSSQ